MLCVLTVVIVYTVPTLLLPVLFSEISAELNLDVFQLGIVWGAMSLTSMFMVVIGGALGDRLGSQRALALMCFLVGLFGMLRGLASSFQLLVGSMLLYGLVAPSLPPTIHKTGAYFFANQRGISTAAISTGFAFALFIGSRYTATWLSPSIGGWRNVLFLFGIFGMVFAVIWLLIPRNILPASTSSKEPFFQSVYVSVRHVLKLRALWRIGIGSLLFWGCVRGFLGYAPLYIRQLGWTAETADNTLSYFFLMSLIFAVPATLLTERIGSRRPVLMGATFAMGTGVILIGLEHPFLVTTGILIGGVLFDAFMANHQAAVLDLEQIGIYTGSALGAIAMFREVGGVFAPPIGNWLAQFGSNWPFFFWGGLGLLATVIFWRMPHNSEVAFDQSS